VVRLSSRRIVFECSDPDLITWIETRFRAFADEGRPDWTVLYEVVAPTPEFLCSPCEVYNEPMEITVTRTGFAVSGQGYEARVDLSLRRVELQGPKATYPVDRMLRLLLPLLVEDGLVVHAGMLSEHGRGWLCSGTSGCGKSTLCELLPEHARCDEMAAVRRVDGCWMVEALPFWKARPATSRLCGIYVLEHHERDERIRLDPARAGRLLSGEVLWPAADTPSLEHRLGLFADLVAEVPVWTLHFRPTREVWRLISGSAA
jgi:hypothetical protein